MLQPPIDQSASASLAKQVEQYLAQGGQIQHLPGPTFPAPPPRREPKRQSGSAQPKRRGRTSASIKRYQEYGPRVLELFERGDPLKQIALAVGRSEPFILRCLDWHGIDGRATRAEQKVKANAGFVEQLRVLARDGHSMRYAAEQLDASASRVRYQAERNGIEFRR
ncbi:MAG: hypothetical protein GX071_00835 [Gammaproteobacteria bacterium]|nr:hypothetical protein [Gammaproteobacteria bacterium]